MRRPSVKELGAKLEASLAAAAFAEESEVETARELLAQAGAPEPRRKPVRR